MSLGQVRSSCSLLCKTGAITNSIMLCRVGLGAGRKIGQMNLSYGASLRRRNGSLLLPLSGSPAKSGRSESFDLTHFPQIECKRMYAKKRNSRSGDGEKSKNVPLTPVEEFDPKKLEIGLQDALDTFRTQITRLLARSGRISPVILDPIRVDIGTGKKVPLDALAAVSANQGNLVLRIYEPDNSNAIVTAIQGSHLSLNPIVDSEEVLRIPIPPLTTEGRKEICKQANNSRNHACSSMRKSAQDFKKRCPDDRAQIEKLTTSKTRLVDDEFKAAEKKIMQE